MPVIINASYNSFLSLPLQLRTLENYLMFHIMESDEIYNLRPDEFDKLLSYKNASDFCLKTLGELTIEDQITFILLVLES